jgi:hypothetical protein
MLQISLFTRSILLKENFYISKYEDAGIYSFVEESINRSLKSIGRTVNLPAELFGSVADKAWVKEQVDIATTKTIEYMTYKTDKLHVIDASKQAEAFNKDLDIYIKKLNLIMDKNVLKEIENIKKEVEVTVKSQASFMDFTAVSKSSTFQKGRKALYFVYNAKNLLVLALFINMLLLCLINIKTLLGFVRWAGYSLIAGGLMVIIPAMVGVFSKFANSISMSEVAIRNFIASVIDASLKYFIFSGSVLLAFGICLTLTSVLMENRKLKRNLSN